MEKHSSFDWEDYFRTNDVETPTSLTITNKGMIRTINFHDLFRDSPNEFVYNLLRRMKSISCLVYQISDTCYYNGKRRIPLLLMLREFSSRLFPKIITELINIELYRGSSGSELFKLHVPKLSQLAKFKYSSNLSERSISSKIFDHIRWKY